MSHCNSAAGGLRWYQLGSWALSWQCHFSEFPTPDHCIGDPLCKLQQCQGDNIMLSHDVTTAMQKLERQHLQLLLTCEASISILAAFLCRRPFTFSMLHLRSTGTASRLIVTAVDGMQGVPQPLPVKLSLSDDDAMALSRCKLSSNIHCRALSLSRNTLTRHQTAQLQLQHLCADKALHLLTAGSCLIKTVMPSATAQEALLSAFMTPCQGGCRAT